MPLSMPNCGRGLLESGTRAAQRAGSVVQSIYGKERRGTHNVGAQVPPLLEAMADGTHSGRFGAVRFGENMRRPPSKFVRLPPLKASRGTSDQMFSDMLDLMHSTWKIAPPCALLSIPEVKDNRALNMSGTSPLCELGPRHCALLSRARSLVPTVKLELLLQRGITEAVQKTRAWIFTSGCAHDVAAQTVGSALDYGMNELSGWRSEAACLLGFPSWVDLREKEPLQTLPNGMVHHYSSLSGDRYSSLSGGAASKDMASASELGEELDPRHSHFLMVDGGRAEAARLRAEFARYISDHDVSKDGIQTPRMILLVGGDAASFKYIHDALDPSDPLTGTPHKSEPHYYGSRYVHTRLSQSLVLLRTCLVTSLGELLLSGTAVPVLVVSDSDGAAEDIFRFVTLGALPTAHDWRDEN